MPRVRLIRVAVGPELAKGERLRVGRSNGGWIVQDQEGHVLARLYTPGIPDDEIEAHEDVLGAIELNRIIKR